MKALALALALAGPSSAELPPPEPVPAALVQPKRLFDAGRYAQVIAALPSDAVQKMHGKTLRRATLYLAESYERTRQLDRALSVYQLGIKLFPSDIDLLAGLARLFHTSRLEEQARPLYNKILDLAPTNISAHLGLAEIDRALGFLDRSADHYETALETRKDDADVWRDYAEVLYQLKEYKTAEIAIEKSLALSPNILDSNLDLAFIERGAGRLSDALATLDKVLAVTGAQRELALTRALWLIEARRLQEAAAQARDVLAADPGNALAHWISGRVAWQSGAREKAGAHFRAALKNAAEGSLIARSSAALLKELP